MSNKKNKTLEKLQLEMKDTLDALGCIEVVSASSRKGDVRFLCRVSDEEKWLRVVTEFLDNEGNWYSFIGKKYFNHEGRLVFGWVFILESDEIDRTVQEVRRLLMTISDGLRPTAIPQHPQADASGKIEIPMAWVGGMERVSSMTKNIK
jgi:hypothetical protein